MSEHGCEGSHTCLIELRPWLFPKHDPALGHVCAFDYRAVQPPSIRMVSPVISDAAGEARKTTAPATSIGSPMRCRAAMRSTTSARKAASASASSVPGVKMNVGATQLTVILY